MYTTSATRVTKASALIMKQSVALLNGPKSDCNSLWELKDFEFGSGPKSGYLAITTVVQELLSLGKSRVAAKWIPSVGRSPRIIGQ